MTEGEDGSHWLSVVLLTGAPDLNATDEAALFGELAEAWWDVGS